jgi:hypothetical protein
VAEHPITPPPELVAKLWREASAGRDDAPIGEIFNHGVLLAYAAGADQELEACLGHLFRCGFSDADILRLRTARRPKPPSLKEQALEALEVEDDSMPLGSLKRAERFALIRRALEALPE